MPDGSAFDLAAAALLVLDFQNDSVDPNGFLRRRGFGAQRPIGGNVRALADGFRAAGKRVIWACTELRADYADCALPRQTIELLGLPETGSCLVQGSWGAGLAEDLAPSPEDVVLAKKGCSAFQGTPLDRLLGNLGVETLVVAGGGLLDGLSDTVRQGGAFGYDMVVASDACGYPDGSAHIDTLAKRAAFASTEKLLAQLASAGQPPERGRRTALIVVDMQNDYVHPDGAQYRYGSNAHPDPEALRRLAANTRRLLEGMRAAGNPVVFVVTQRRHDPLDNASPPAALRTPPVPYEYDYLVEGSWGAQVIDEIAPQPEDFVERKKGRSGFGFSPLHRLLRNLGVTDCVMSGGAVHGCLEDTIREGASFGYGFTLVTDAVYPAAPSEASRQVLGSHTGFNTTDEVLAQVRQARR